MAKTDRAPNAKPYVSAQELADLTPWTENAIKNMIRRGVLREREHYFHVGRRLVFRWDAIVALIERSGRTIGEAASNLADAVRRRHVPLLALLTAFSILVDLADGIIGNAGI
jgi:hypothetical protein